MKTYSTVDYRAVPLFADVSEEEWRDWRWQLRNVIRDVPTLAKIIDLTDEEKLKLNNVLERFSMAITPYYAALMDRQDRLCSVRLQAVPDVRELDTVREDLVDPLHEDVDASVPGLTHRYPDRVLFLVTNICSMNCRHCTRRRLVGFEDQHLSRSDIDRALEYIRQHKEVRDVLISGGDPLTMATKQLEYLLRNLREIEHIEIIRIGTRVPVVLPMRITDELVEMLRRYHPLYVNTHFNHYKEVTAEAKQACEKLADAGIPLGNQSVLLRDVNDCPRIMKKLVHELMMIRVKPYYIYQCDMSKGISHFRTAISKGMEIIENLRGHTTGMAVPTFVVDAPGGGGKIPVMPNYLLSQSDKRVILRNYEGVITSYSQPENIYSDCWCELCKANSYGPLDGVAKLLLGAKLVLEPHDLMRIARHQSEDD
jgi:lysine 2,3-aminomutase